ncbi:BMP family ABC transporter substrate-binding protein [Actinocrinis puniceicyclus]|uniref:BMP family ABC transporter substrate-binding protein n=1 Tax=Actinocrinis puniceicyclus TaxID=977794 RepID=A0A8J7WKE9_9ACTN|nr:BMP family ABC transporter substrate-binding protein [Actinocrinis puniceicyclus]MBS2961752.1 BMP family ABC transporter substrate-binding protein [Actinocrinis puniceicyclus]
MKQTRFVAALAVVGLAAAACGSKPVTTTSGASAAASGGASAGNFTACMVTDTGGIDDHSFNSAAWAGMQKAQSDGKATVSFVQSATENQYTSNISSLLSKGCKLIVTVGGLMADATTASAKVHTSQDYTIVDSGSVPPNVKGLQFNTAQGAFLGGYLAAGYSKSGKVATFGGLNIAPVTVYMDGFWEGVQYYNSKHATHVQVLGWNETTRQGSFAQSFTDQNVGKQLAAGFLSQGADIVFPVAGGTGLGALAEAQQSNGAMNAIWVDTDGFTAAPQYANVLITSVLKGISDAVTKSVEDAASGNFNATAYVGTLANGGTGLAPYHNFEGKIPASLTSELTQVKQGIISGSITIKSKAQPTG